MGIKLGNTNISKIKIASGLTPRLPSAYQEVEYIESSGTQHIDTGYNPIYGTKIACKFMHNEHSLDTPVFGRRQSGGNYEYTLRSHPSEKASQGAVRYNIMSANGISVNSYPQGTIIEFEYNQSSYKYGSQTGSISPSTSNVTGINLIMFGLREGSSIDSRKFSGRMYYFTIWENGTLVRDFVPCYRKNDGVIGMYDLVNDMFYTNAGSGTFSKGDDINLPYKEIKKVFLGSIQVRPSRWEPGANTVAYYQFDGNLNDSSGNNRNIGSGGGTFTYGTLSSGAKYIQLNTSAYSNYLSIPYNFDATTFSCWCQCGTVITNNNTKIYVDAHTWTGSDNWARIFQQQSKIWGGLVGDGTTATQGQWYYFTLVHDNKTTYAYVNGSLVTTVASNYDKTSARLRINSSGDYSGTFYAGDGKLSELIFENKVRSAGEIMSYYDQTKGDYGIS